MYQVLAWQLSLILIAILLAGFLFVVLHSRDRGDDQTQLIDRAYSIRAKLFWAIVFLVTPVMLYSLTDLPNATAAQARGNTTAQVVDAVGHQWYWTLSQNQVSAGTPVEFRVTSDDVNHGFAIYNSEMKLVAQTMAMPEYTNILRYTFNEPGTYRILCLEYCGLAHHAMMAEIEVSR